MALGFCVEYLWASVAHGYSEKTHSEEWKDSFWVFNSWHNELTFRIQTLHKLEMTRSGYPSVRRYFSVEVFSSRDLIISVNPMGNYSRQRAGHGRSNKRRGGGGGRIHFEVQNLPLPFQFFQRAQFQSGKNPFISPTPSQEADFIWGMKHTPLLTLHKTLWKEKRRVLRHPTQWTQSCQNAWMYILPVEKKRCQVFWGHLYWNN